MTLLPSSASRFWQLVPLSAVLLIAGSIFLAMALMEGILRFFPGLLPVELQQLIQADPNNYGVTHPYIGHLHKPNNALVISGRDFSAVHHTDAHGFRNTWPWPERAEIVTVGDSLTFGYGVEDYQAWPALLAKRLPHNPLINLALIGGGPQQYLRVYETFGAKLRPKVLLVGFFIRNDFWDAEMFDRWLKSGAGGNYVNWRDFGRPRSVSLSLQQPVGKLIKSLQWRGELIMRKSHLYNLLLYARGYIKRWIPSEIKVFDALDGTSLELQPGGLASRTKEAQRGHRVFDIALEALQRVYSLASADGTSVLVVLQPSKEEVYLPLLGEPAPDPGAPLRATLGELGIPYLDLLQDFRHRAAKGEVLFFEADGHPNARGYALIAERVLAHLKTHAKRYSLNDSVQTSSQ
jgi:SGNH hydrolase-like domain, acetyltransferase AlgX